MLKRSFVCTILAAVLVFPSTTSAGLIGDFFAQILTMLVQLHPTQESRIETQGHTAAVAGASMTTSPTAANSEKEIEFLTNTIQSNNQTATGLELAKKRAGLMQHLAESDPAAFLHNTIPAGRRAKLSTALQQEVEQQVSLTGNIEVLHRDDFENKSNSRFEYHLRSGGKRLSLHFVGNAPALSSGSLVNVKGYQIGTKVVAAGDSAGLSVIDPQEPESVGTQNTLMILITSPGQASTPTKEQMKSMIFSGVFKQYYDEQSYGKTTFVGDVTNWISVPATAVSWCLAPNLDQLEVKNYITQNGINLSTYDRVMFVNNGMGGGCAYVGKLDVTFNGQTYRLSLGWTGFSGSQYDYGGMSSFEYVLAHEMGHELGVMHANAWSCTGQSLDTNCLHAEYGNSFDVMGNGYFAKHFNAFYKDYLGWLSPSDKVEITHSGPYSLAPIESQTGIRAAVIRNPALPSLAESPTYLEFKQPIGFDKFLPLQYAGLHINQVIKPYNWSFPMTRLLNANYATDSQSQPALMQGGTFSWPSRGLAVDSVVLTPASASFLVKMRTPQCVRHGIGISDVNERITFASGANGWVQFVLTNNDDPVCKSSEVSIRASISGAEEWYIGQYPDPTTSFVLAAGQSAYANVVFVPPANISSAIRTVTISITDKTNNRVVTLTREITVVPPPRVDSVAPQSGGPGTDITLQGSGFAGGKDANSIFITMATATPIYTSVNITQAASDSLLTFKFPTTVYRFDERDGMYREVPPPIGEYQLQVTNYENGGQSNRASFIVSPPPPTNLSCTLSDVTVLHAASRVFYSRSTTPYGTLCSSYGMNRTCTNGVLSGSSAFSAAACNVETPKSCTLSGVTVAHGKNRRFYRYPTSANCLGTSILRTCNNGVLSGNSLYSKPKCVAN